MEPDLDLQGSIPLAQSSSCLSMLLRCVGAPRFCGSGSSKIGNTSGGAVPIDTNGDDIPDFYNEADKAHSLCRSQTSHDSGIGTRLFRTLAWFPLHTCGADQAASKHCWTLLLFFVRAELLLR